MKRALGLVIGKFYPPHLGHVFLIETALAQSERVVVLVCERPTDTIAGALRAAWLRELCPACDVRVIDDRYDEQDSQVWATNTLGWLGRAPDAVFTSEAYGDRYARLMGSVHVSVDPARQQVAISGTRIRQDPYAHWDYLGAGARAFFAKRVCVLGAESTGTTTLARALSTRLQTSWVAEYGREYSEEKQRRGEQGWGGAELALIAAEQTRRENVAARDANRVLVCDTNAFATCLWSRRYCGSVSPELARIAETTRCDLYLLTGDEIPFVQDGLRDGEHIRHAMHGWFEAALGQQASPWRLLRGSPDERLEAALHAVGALFETSAWVGPFA